MSLLLGDRIDLRQCIVYARVKAFIYGVKGQYISCRLLCTNIIRAHECS